MKSELKQQVIKLRKEGKTYSEIRNMLGYDIAKSTLSCWCRDIELPKLYSIKIKELSSNNLKRARLAADKSLAERRVKYFEKIRRDNSYLKNILVNHDVSKLLLSGLYLAEGGKKTSGALMFGNSDPLIIKLFLKLLRLTYKIDESKFRCTVQCRADQNISVLKKFWCKTTRIPASQFYKANVDKRTVGKRTVRADYKGVCRIDYFSANIFHELTVVGQIITE